MGALGSASARVAQSVDGSFSGESSEEMGGTTFVTAQNAAVPAPAAMAMIGDGCKKNQGKLPVGVTITKAPLRSCGFPPIATADPPLCSG